MKLSPAIWKETKHILVGTLMGDAIMLVVFALLKHLDYTVFLGAALGSVTVVVNFFLMGVRAQKAMEDPDRARLIIQKSYTTRMLLMVAVMAVGVMVDCFHTVAVIIPFLFPGLTIKLMQILTHTRSGEKGGEKQ